ncbi:MAG: excinuclease ABC subunit C [Chitinophagaceae bacterium]
MPFFVYVLFSETAGKFYIGQTQDIDNRLKRHNNGLEKFTQPYLPWILKCVIEKSSRSEAVILEKKLKNLNKEKLIKFMEKYI